MKYIIILGVILIHFSALAQKVVNKQIRHKSPLVEEIKDSVFAKTDNIEVWNYYTWSKDIFKKIVEMKLKNPNNIFETSNDFSRLVISDNYGNEKSIPTIPLKHLIIIPKDSLIIGLTDIISTPYNVVIYNFKGELLSKVRLQSLYFKFGIDQLEKLKINFPDKFECLKNGQHIFKEGKYYYAEFFASCNDVLKTDNFFGSLADLVGNPFLRSMTDPITESSIGFRRSKHMFSDSDPFYDLLVVNKEPYLLRVNDFEGKVVDIPLRFQYVD